MLAATLGLLWVALTNTTVASAGEDRTEPLPPGGWISHFYQQEYADDDQQNGAPPFAFLSELCSYNKIAHPDIQSCDNVKPGQLVTLPSYGMLQFMRNNQVSLVGSDELIQKLPPKLRKAAETIADRYSASRGQLVDERIRNWSVCIVRMATGAGISEDQVLQRASSADIDEISNEVLSPIPLPTMSYDTNGETIRSVYHGAAAE